MRRAASPVARLLRDVTLRVAEPATRRVLVCAAGLFVLTCITIAAQPRRATLPDGQPVIVDRDIQIRNRLRIRELEREGIVATEPGTRIDALETTLFFEENRGQFDRRASFVTRGSTYNVFAVPSGFVSIVGRMPREMTEETEGSARNATAVAFRLLRATSVAGRGEGRLSGVAHRFLSGNAQRGIPLYRAVRYPAVYRGVDMFLSAHGGKPSYGFMVAPQGDVARIRFGVDGATALRVDARGNLVVETANGAIAHTRPLFIEELNGVKRKLQGEFIIIGRNQFGFSVDGRSPGSRLLIDPLVVFSTYFGGTGQEGMLGGDAGAADTLARGFDIAIGAQGDVFVTGLTFSADLPTTIGGPINGSSDAFVLRLNPSQQANPIVYVTYLGGAEQDRARALSPRADGSVYVTGFTFSSDFPVTAGTVAPVQRSGAFIARLAPDGGFDIGTMISPGGGFHPNAIQWEQQGTDPLVGDLFVGGWVTGGEATGQGAIATSGAFQTSVAGGTDGFLAKLDPNLTAYGYLTFLGGSRTDVVMDIDALDGSVFATGTTTSLNFPSTEFAAQPAHSGSAGTPDCATGTAAQCADSFVTRVRADGTGLIYSTFIGSGSTEDFARGIAVAPNGQAVITGGTRPADGSNLSSIFAKRLESLGGAILYDVSVPGTVSDHGEEIVVDQLGRAHITGTISIDGAARGLTAETFHGGNSDFFYTRITDDGDIDFFTYLGGSATDRGFAIAAAGASEESFCATVAGSTTSADLQVINAIQDEPASAQADLALVALCDFPLPPTIVKTGPSTARTGDVITYTIVVTNPGDEPVTVTVADTVPAGLTVTGVIGCNRTGNAVSCPLTVSGGNAVPIVVTATVGGDCNRSITNTATMTVEGREISSPPVSTRIECPPPPPSPCGNGRLDAGEACDGGAGCRSNCTRIECGDGIFDLNEQCDDGNNNDGDACDNQCRTRVTQGGDCSSSGPACAADLQCVRKCSFVDHECHGVVVDVLFTGWLVCVGIDVDATTLCSVDAKCIPPGDVDGDDRVIGQ